MLRKKKKRVLGILCILCLLGSVGCKAEPTEGTRLPETEQQEYGSDGNYIKEEPEVTAAPEGREGISAVKERENNENAEQKATVVLSDTGIAIDGTGCVADGNRLKIEEAGGYEIRGTLSDGSIFVNADNESEVHLILNGVTVHNETGAALYCKKASTVTITLVSGTVNTLSDGASYEPEEGETEPDATLFAKNDLVINGDGKLVVTSSYKDAVKGKDSVYILGGELLVNAADDGIIGRDLFYVADSKITVNAAADALKSTNDTDETLGNIIIDGGEFYLTAGQDGMQAENSITVNDGVFVIETGGGSTNASVKAGENPFQFGKGWGNRGKKENEAIDENAESESSAKGLKAGVLLAVSGGRFELDTSDDALHGNKDVKISGGDFLISSGDDGAHADETLQIEGDSKLRITKSYEGLEALEIMISGGEIEIVASDDGLNAAGGADGSGFGRPGAGMFGEGEGEVTINGGTITVDASGDGLDSNGNLTVNGGTVYVYGPTSGGNGVLDYGGTFCANGGTLLGIGTSDMAQTPANSSGQYSLAAVLTTRGNAGDTVEIMVDGETVLSVQTPKTFNYVVVSTKEFVKDAQVSVMVAGTEIYTGILTDVVTCFGMSGGMGGFGGFGGMGGFGDKGGFVRNRKNPD